MKQLFLFAALLVIGFANAQVKIGNNPTSLNPASILELESTTQGFLPPRLTYAQKTAIVTPPAGLTVWCTNCGTSGEMQFFNGTIWVASSVVAGALAKPSAPTSPVASAGNAQASVAFTVPLSNGGSVITGYTVTSSPDGFTATGTTSPLIVTGLSNGTSYTFTILATNAVGNSVASVASNAVTLEFTVPDAPTSPVATAGNAQASVAFTVPLSNGGSVITGYTVTSSPGGFTATGTTSPLIVSGLTNGTSYTFTVVATNIVGNSVASAASNAVTPITIPNAPTSPIATLGNAQASVAFTAPVANGGSVITGYTVTSSSGSFTATGTTSPLIVSGLTNGTSYTFTVVATNTVGNSFASVASNAVTPMTVPNAPTSPIATAGNTQASVAFTAPIANGGTVISGYTVTSSPVGFTAIGPTSPLIVTGLTNGTSYTFTVVATNAVGNSVVSAASNAVTPNILPNAPTSSVATAGNAQATVAFSVPVANGGTAITGYTVTASPGGFTKTGTTSPLIVTGLTNGTSYTFTVVSTNTMGNSVASAASNAVTPKTVPNAPTSPIATTGNAQASVAFVAPVVNGGSAITGYTVTSSPGNSTKTGTTSPLIVTGLTNGTSYTFTVVATNVVGNSVASTVSNAVMPLSNATIGSQVWTTTNLDVTTYRNGDVIPQVTDPTAFWALTTGAWCYHNNNSANGAVYGKLYNWYAVNDPRGLAPTGWHIPSDAEWTTLTTTLGGTASAGGAMKEVGTAHWLSPNTGANNSSGFTALPGGYNNGAFGAMSSTGIWWSSSESGITNYIYARNIDYNSGDARRDIFLKAHGFSVRCRRDAVAGSFTVADAPTSVVATAGNAQTNITFVAPLYNGGSAITAYTVTSSPGGYTATGTSSPLTVTGLTYGTSYTFTVVATNAVGNSIASAASNAVTFITVPDAPISIIATVANVQASVTFTAPTSDGGSAITGYSVTSSPASSPATFTGTGSPIVVTGLTYGTSYTFMVVATNAAGNSVASAASNAVTPFLPITIGLHPELGGYVFYVAPDGLHGLVSETQDQGYTDWYNTLTYSGVFGSSQNYSAAGQNFFNWRLPTIGELTQMYNSRNEIGGFGSYYYWSSTEDVQPYAYLLNFSDGLVNRAEKRNWLGVRGVRAF